MPRGLHDSISYIFHQGVSGVALVGGTALAGYYAGHRKSDDIDLFVKDEDCFKAALLAIMQLPSIGATLLKEIQSTKQYHKTLFKHLNHEFTIDLVLDSNFHSVAELTNADEVKVATLNDLLKMKMATLVSRCGEKDLYDLIWLFDHFSKTTLEEKIDLGQAIDGGLNPENVLTSLCGSKPRQNGCGFCEGFGKSKSTVFKEISAFRNSMIRALIDLNRGTPTQTGLDKIK